MTVTVVDSAELLTTMLVCRLVKMKKYKRSRFFPLRLGIGIRTKIIKTIRVIIKTPLPCYLRLHSVGPLHWPERVYSLS